MNKSSYLLFVALFAVFGVLAYILIHDRGNPDTPYPSGLDGHAGMAARRIGQACPGGCPAVEGSPGINSRGQVVWQQWDGDDYEILLFDGSSTLRLTGNFCDDIDPHIDDLGRVAWREFDGEDYEVWFYDGESIRQLTDNSYDEVGLQLNGRGQMVWWSEPKSAGKEISFYDGSKIIQLAKGVALAGNPRLNAEGDVIWVAGREVFLYDGKRVTKILADTRDWENTSRHGGRRRSLVQGGGGEVHAGVFRSTCIPENTGRHDRGMSGRPVSAFGVDGDGNKAGKGVWTGGGDPFSSVPGVRPGSFVQMACLRGIDGLFGGVTDDGIVPSVEKIRRGSAKTVEAVRANSPPVGLGSPQVEVEAPPESHGKKPLEAPDEEGKVDWKAVRVIGSSILKYSRRYHVDPALVLAIINAESEFEHSSVSHKGAIGLMQLMPSTAARLGVDPYDIEENIKGGIKHLGFLLSRFDSLEMVIAAYNAGSANVRKYKGVPPFKETKRYVRKVLAYYEGKKP
ncbi:MAG: transglycosylase SLT domain-containing protein [Deltaproteobacteria bacterium]|nr:transglycosylase SLT domain-containing protein [Deltaproteobacteria bacterium]